MNSLENVFARRAEKTSEAIYETVRDSWPARRCNLHDGLENLDNLMESVYSVTSNIDRIWESIDRMNFPKHLKETALDLVGTSHALQSKLYPRWMSAKGQHEEGWEKVVRENNITHEGIFTEYTAHLVGKDDNAILAGATWQTVLLHKGFLVKELSVHLPSVPVLPQEVLHGRVWEFSCRGLRSMSRKVAEEIARTWNRTYWGLARIDQDAIEIHQPRVPIR